MEKNRNDILYTISLMMQLGMSIVAPVVLVVLISRALIEKYRWSSKFLLIAILIGLLAGFLNAYKLLSRFLNKKS